MTDPAQPPSRRSTVRRGARRASYDQTTIRAILDDALICHVAVDTESGPLVLPMAYGRIEDILYLHGAASNGVLNAAADGEMCVTVTELDGLVFARSAFHNSMNYRCVVVRGRGRRVDGDEKVAGLRSVADHVVATWDNGREPTMTEVRSTVVVALSLHEASAKVRSGDPLDEPEDLSGPWWAGTVALRQGWAEPVDAHDLNAEVAVPAPVAGLAV